MADGIKLVLWLLLVSSSSSCFGSDLDVQCLKTVQQSVIDPNGILKSSWIFDNSTAGYICQFTGVECWQPYEHGVLSLDLSSLGLEGQFPRGLENCTSMTVLDLSSNNFSGPIPSDIARKLPFLQSLDLSYNSFSGEIPIGISNLLYMVSLNLSYNSFSGEIPIGISNLLFLNTLNLQHNQLSGEIPGVPDRLQWFYVGDNLLSGTIPSALQKYPASTFAGNQELCGAPLNDCPSKWKRRINDESSIGAAAGFVVGFLVAFYFPHCFVCSRRLHPYIFRIC